MNKYQTVIIGLGRAGEALTVTLVKAGWRVALTEQSSVVYGRTYINIDCISTETLVHDAQQHTGFVCAMQHKNEAINFLRNKNSHNPADMPNISVISSQAEFINNHNLRVHRPGRDLEIHGEKVFINTGARAVVPPTPGTTTTPGVHDNIKLLNLKELPRHLGILDGGYTDVEFASMFANFGSKVTISEIASLFLPREDWDVADDIATILRSQGIDIILNTHVERISHHESQVQVHSEYTQPTVDALLIASGRQPAIASLHPENAGIAVNGRGVTVVDRQLHTTADNIWAMGDVTGGLQFTYISLDDHRTVRDELLGGDRRSTGDRENASYSIFMTLLLSRVGMVEEQTRENNVDIQVVTLPAAATPHARVMNDIRGVSKAIVDNKTQRVLGAPLLCINSHEIINIAKMVMDAGLPYSMLCDQIFTHPSMSGSLNDLFSLVEQAQNQTPG